MYIFPGETMGNGRRISDELSISLKYLKIHIKRNDICWAKSNCVLQTWTRNIIEKKKKNFSFIPCNILCNKFYIGYMSDTARFINEK